MASDVDTGLGFMQAMFMMALIAALVYLAMWGALVLAVLWIVFHLVMTHQTTDPAASQATAEAQERTSWLAVVAVALAASSLVPMLFMTQLGLAETWYTPALILAGVALAVRVLGAGSPNGPTGRFGMRFTTGVAVGVLALAGVNAWVDRPLGVEARYFEPAGAATSLEEAWQQAGCMAGTTALVEDEIPWLVDLGGARQLGTCSVTDDQDFPTVFLLFDSQDQLVDVVDRGAVKVDEDALDKLGSASFGTNGSVMLILDISASYTIESTVDPEFQDWLIH